MLRAGLLQGSGLQDDLRRRHDRSLLQPLRAGMPHGDLHGLRVQAGSLHRHPHRPLLRAVRRVRHLHPDGCPPGLQGSSLRGSDLQHLRSGLLVLRLRRLQPPRPVQPQLVVVVRLPQQLRLRPLNNPELPSPRRKLLEGLVTRKVTGPFAFPAARFLFALLFRSCILRSDHWIVTLCSASLPTLPSIAPIPPTAELPPAPASPFVASTRRSF
jgi:hypothetical protein